MATSSIFTTFRFNDEESAQKLLRALEESEKEAKESHKDGKVKEIHVHKLEDLDEIKEFFKDRFKA